MALFPKPGKKKKKKRETDDDYIEWIKSLKCCITRSPSPDPHHVNEAGHGAVASKTNDSRAVPLAHRLHQELHSIGQHTFARKYGLDYEATIEALNKLYEEQGGILNGN